MYLKKQLKVFASRLFYGFSGVFYAVIHVFPRFLEGSRVFSVVFSMVF